MRGLLPIEKPAHAEARKPKAKAPKRVDRETQVWNFFVSKGFTKQQTAGIMGNLQQEHPGFNTADVPGGLGIAQWMGGRRARLMNKQNYLHLDVQLNFIVEELNSTESAAKRALIASSTTEEATQAFQDHYERCNPLYCNLAKRIEYAKGFASKR